MSVPRPTRSQLGLLTKSKKPSMAKWLAAHYLAQWDENEALAKALEQIKNALDDDRIGQAGLLATDALAEYAKRKQEGPANETL